MKNLNLKDEYLKILTDIFSSYCPDAEIWAYGSRVNGDCHDASDLDMVVKSFNDENCNISTLKELICNSNIPILTDILLFDDISKAMQNEILKKYIVIYP